MDWFNFSRFLTLLGGTCTLFGIAGLWYFGNISKKNTNKQIEILQNEKAELQEKVKPENLEKEYKEVKKEIALDEIKSNPDNICNETYLFDLKSALLGDAEYTILKKAFLKASKINRDGCSPLWEYQILMFEIFPEKVINDEETQELFETEITIENEIRNHLNANYSNKQIITANRYFLIHCLKNGGIKKNKDRINSFLLKDENKLLDLNGDFGDINLYTDILNIIKDKNDRIELFDIVTSSIFKINFGIVLLKEYGQKSNDYKKNNLTEIRNKIIDLKSN